MNTNSPEDTISIIIKSVTKRSKNSIFKTLLLAFLAGAYISFGAILAIIVAGGSPSLAKANPGLSKLLFGAVFPLGIVLVALAGAELFTGNTSYFIPALLKRKTNIKSLFKNWGLVYLGNFIGSLFIAFFLVYLCDLFSENPWLDFTHKIAYKKVSASFLKVFIKGIACNWLVALAMWIIYSSKSTTGKIAGSWFPIMGFATIGFEHCVANMFLIPIAILNGADITVYQFILNNLIPTTLGNITGGAFFVGFIYWYIHKDHKVN